jgi:hypothetical protein
LSLLEDWATLEGMVALIIGMLICIGLALAVVLLVAVPARRDGRDVLTARGEEVVAAIRAQATAAGAESSERGATTTEAADGPPSPGPLDPDGATAHEVGHGRPSRAS